MSYSRILSRCYDSICQVNWRTKYVVKYSLKWATVGATLGLVSSGLAVFGQAEHLKCHFGEMHLKEYPGCRLENVSIFMPCEITCEDQTQRFWFMNRVADEAYGVATETFKTLSMPIAVVGGAVLFGALAARSAWKKTREQLQAANPNVVIIDVAEEVHDQDYDYHPLHIESKNSSQTPPKIKTLSERLFEAKYDGEIPNSHCCPLSHKIMDKPVIASDGYTYDEKFILDYIAKLQAEGKPITSPSDPNVKLQFLGNAWVLDNWDVKKVIENFVTNQENVAYHRQHSEMNIPECPLSLQLMSDPVIASDGNSYNEGWIMQHIQTNGSPRSPIDNKTPLRQLIGESWTVPNRLLTVMIQELNSNKKSKETELSTRSILRS